MLDWAKQNAETEPNICQTYKDLSIDVDWNSFGCNTFIPVDDSDL